MCLHKTWKDPTWGSLFLVSAVNDTNQILFSKLLTRWHILGNDFIVLVTKLSVWGSVRINFTEGRPHISHLSDCQGPSFPARPQHIKKPHISTRSEAVLKPPVWNDNKTEGKIREKMRPLLLWKIEDISGCIRQKKMFSIACSVSAVWRREGVSDLLHY